MDKASRASRLLIAAQTKRYDREIAFQVKHARKSWKYRATPETRLKKEATSEFDAQRRKKLAEDHLQWHRWYQENKKRQRSVKGLKKKVKGNYVFDLKREAVF